MLMHQNSYVDDRRTCGLHKLWPTLVHVHIATEVLWTLHPGATGPCFIVKSLVGDSDR